MASHYQGGIGGEMALKRPVDIVFYIIVVDLASTCHTYDGYDNHLIHAVDSLLSKKKSIEDINTINMIDKLVPLSLGF